MHIALLEDPSIMEILTVALERQGHTAISFPDAILAITACIESQIDLLITEIKLPHSAIDGLDTIRLIQLRRPAFPALILSIYSRSQIAAMCGDLHNVSVLQKPFCKAQFDEKVRFLQSSVPSTPPCKPRLPQPQSARLSL